MRYTVDKKYTTKSWRRDARGLTPVILTSGQQVFSVYFIKLHSSRLKSTTKTGNRGEGNYVDCMRPDRSCTEAA